jgi:hypothetical protein
LSPHAQAVAVAHWLLRSVSHAVHAVAIGS